MSNTKQLDTPSRTTLFALIFGIISFLTGPALGFIGLIIRLLKILRVIYFEGRIGIGGLAGGFGFIFALVFGVVGLVLGIRARGKVRQGDAPKNDEKRAMIAIILSVTSVILSVLILVAILFTLEM